MKLLKYCTFNYENEKFAYYISRASARCIAKFIFSLCTFIIYLFASENAALHYNNAVVENRYIRQIQCKQSLKIRISLRNKVGPVQHQNQINFRAD